MSYIAVAGGVNMDVAARPFRRPIPKESNPGLVHTGPGGVGRNIAHDLRLLGAEVELLTAYGDDGYGRQVEESCAALGIGLSHSLRVPGASTSAYVYISDEKGDMQLAVSDMAVCEQLTPAYFAAREAVLRDAALVVADANLPEASLRWLAEHVEVPLFVDPVSAAKSEKLLPILPRIHTLKPNRMEAELLSGVPVVDRSSARRAARRLIELGVRRVFLSLGKEGFLAAAEDETVWQPSIPAPVVSTTGAGDAMMAALAWSWLRGDNLTRASALGAAAAAIAVECEGSVNPALSAEAALRRAEG